LMGRICSLDETKEFLLVCAGKQLVLEPLRQRLGRNWDLNPDRTE
jgi:hypothetical protein